MFCSKELTSYIYETQQFYKYTHFIFDLDGTIAELNIDWGPWKDACICFFAKYHYPYHAQSRFNYEQFNALIELYGDPVRQEIHHMVETAEYENYHGYNEVEPGLTFLKKLPMTTKKYLWTANSSKVAHATIDQMGLRETFEKIVTHDNVPYGKPHKAGFEAIWDGITPHGEYVLIGDSDNDRQAAYNSSIEFVHVNDISLSEV